MKHSKYQQELGSTAACTKIMMEETKRIGQKSIKGGTKDFFLFVSWFTSKNATEAVIGGWCRVDWYGEEKYQRILQGDH